MDAKVQKIECGGTGGGMKGQSLVSLDGTPNEKRVMLT